MLLKYYILLYIFINQNILETNVRPSIQQPKFGNITGQWAPALHLMNMWMAKQKNENKNRWNNQV